MITIKKDKQIIKYTGDIKIDGIHKLNNYLNSVWLRNQSTLVKNGRTNYKMHSVNKAQIKLGITE